MNAARYILLVFNIFLALTWTTTAIAAGVIVHERPMLELDLVLLAMGTLLSTLAGATALAIRLNNLFMGDPETGETRPLIKPYLFASAHMGGSWCAGAAVFAWGRSSNWDVWMSLFAVLVASFGGSKFMELVAERMANSLPLPGGGGAKPRAPKEE